MNLPKEWEAIASDPVQFGGNRREAVERCYALHTKPKRELTDAECYELWTSIYCGQFTSNCWPGYNNGTEVIRSILAAHEAKQREPETVTFRAARSRVDGKPMVFEADAHLELTIWEWLEPPQTFEVTLP